MDSAGEILKLVLAFLLKFLELFVSFFILALTLFLDFFRTMVGAVS